MIKIILLIFTYINIYASHISWYNNFENAHKTAIREDKELMDLVINKGFYKNTIIDTFINQKYIDKVNERYISVLVTKNQYESYPREMLFTNVYPTIFFLDKYELFTCDNLTGIITPKSFKTHLKYCED